MLPSTFIRLLALVIRSATPASSHHHRRTMR
jgi:hypothetical protein